MATPANKCVYEGPAWGKYWRKSEEGAGGRVPLELGSGADRPLLRVVVRGALRAGVAVFACPRVHVPAAVGER